MKKIIFLDIDGTLRDFDGTIPESAVKAIHEAQKNGHKVCLSTGRPYPRIKKECWISDSTESWQAQEATPSMMENAFHTVYSA